jgi:nucleotide-binding universal stress UspA family protein
MEMNGNIPPVAPPVRGCAMTQLVPAQGIRLKSVLVATDFSEASRKPLQHAITVARHYGARFYLAHIVSSLGFTLAGPDVIVAATEAARKDALQLEHELSERGSLSGLQHEVIVRQGNVWDELEKIISEKDIDLVVIGTHGRRGLGKLLLGSVAEQIFRHARCRVLTVGPGCFPDSPIEKTARPILFATDFSAASLHALPYAISIANERRTKLLLMHVVPEVPMPPGFHWCTADDVTRMREKARVDSILRLTELIPPHTKCVIEPEFVVEFGQPSEQILRAAETLEPELIAMGLNHSRHSPTAADMPWATAYETVCAANCPVLTVRN